MGVTKSCKYVTRVLQGYNGNLTGMLQGCYRVGKGVIQGVLQNHCQYVTGVLKGFTVV